MSITAKEAAELALSYRAQRQARLDLQHQVDEMEVAEKQTKAAFVAALKELEIGGVTAAGRQIGFEEENEPMVENWPDLYAHIQKTGEFDLLNKALNAKAVKARWEAGEGVPGVGWFPADKFFDRKS